MGYILASLGGDATSETLVVQTDTLAPITVTTIPIATPGPNVTQQVLGNTSVTSNADGSFDVLWSVYSETFGSSSIIPDYSPTTEYEQAYSASGEALGPAVAIATAPSDGGYNFHAATATASGGYILDSLGGDATVETLVVQTDTLAPITVTSVPVVAPGPNVTQQVLGNTAVTSNADGSFDVLWSVYSETSGSSSIIPDYGPTTEYEQAYSASGEALGPAVAIATAPSDGGYNFHAATATASGGYILDTLRGRCNERNARCSNGQTRAYHCHLRPHSSPGPKRTPPGAGKHFGHIECRRLLRCVVVRLFRNVWVKQHHTGYSPTTEYEQAYSASAGSWAPPLRSPRRLLTAAITSLPRPEQVRQEERRHRL